MTTPPVSLNPRDQTQLFISANTSLSSCTFFHILDQTQTKDFRHAHQQDGKLVFHNIESSNNNQACNSSSVMADSSSACGHHNLSFYNKIENEKWMSNSNVRLTRKMMSQPSSDLAAKKKAFNNNIIRVCADCNTTSTPLWRSGPNGPKSLCNACGIRQRKARRAMDEAVKPSMNMNASSTKTRVHNKEKKSRANHLARSKNNKCKATTAAGTSQQEKMKIDFKDFAISLRDNSALNQVPFPMDEVAEAALLLVDLSSGFVYF